MSERIEVPDASYEWIDRATDLLCNATIFDLDILQAGNVDVLLAGLLNQIVARAEALAEEQLVPGKIKDSVLEKNIPGYREAHELSMYLIGVLKKPGD